MKTYWIIFLFAFAFLGIKAQSFEVDLDTCKVFTTLEDALHHPEEVYILNLSKQKLKTVPVEILQFKNLRSLDLSKNRLSEVPFELAQLKDLEIVDFEKNEFTVFPIVLTELLYLKKLTISQNDISEIPHDINKLQKLEHLDMWSNNLYVVPESISELKELKYFDLRVIQMSQEEQDRINKLLPNTKVFFSVTCNCSN